MDNLDYSFLYYKYKKQFIKKKNFILNSSIIDGGLPSFLKKNNKIKPEPSQAPDPGSDSFNNAKSADLSYDNFHRDSSPSSSVTFLNKIIKDSLIVSDIIKKASFNIDENNKVEIKSKYKEINNYIRDNKYKYLFNFLEKMMKKAMLKMIFLIYNI